MVLLTTYLCVINKYPGTLVKKVCSKIGSMANCINFINLRLLLNELFHSTFHSQIKASIAQYILQCCQSPNFALLSSISLHSIEQQKIVHTGTDNF